MPPKSWGSSNQWLYQFVLLLMISLCGGTDVFCGQLTVYKQQWFEKSTLTLGARTSADLKDCLNFCCGIPDCQAVTFMGFLKNSPNPTANCVMFTCGPSGECQTVTDPVATDGVVSVVIKNAPTSAQSDSKDETAVAELLSNSTQPPTNQTMTDPEVETTSSDDTTAAPTVVFGDDDEGASPPEPTKAKKMSNEPQQNSTNTSAPQHPRSQPRATTTHAPVAVTTESTFLSDLAPVWVIGILIVITVTCAGTCLVLLSVYFCVRRSKTKMRSQPITSLKAGTLHAFNPTTLHTTSTMA